MKWIMAGNRGMLYVRVMRAPSAVIYADNFEFEFGRAYVLRETADDKAVIVTSGRAVHEALAAAAACAARGVQVGVVDMPSVDDDKLLSLCDSGKLIVFAEQNNGYLWKNAIKTAARQGKPLGAMVAVNAMTVEMKPQFIHSGTYEELLDAFNLSPAKLVDLITGRLS
jgi:transketolase C-terminal domain/subunit